LIVTFPAAILKGQVVWITGASSGIGEVLAYRLSLFGCKLILSGTNERALDDVRSRCLQLNKNDASAVISIAFDIKDVSKHESYFKQVLQHFGNIDILVNNAGRSLRAMFHEIDLSVDEEMYRINVLGPINLTRLVVNHWYSSKKKGHLVVTSSTLGKMGIMNGSSYAATKHALHGYFESIRHEAFENDIDVTMICPGPVFSKAAERAFTCTIDKTFEGNHTPDMNRMKTDRCAHLMTIAIANKLDEVWICMQPILLMYYGTQYFPSLSRFFVPRFLNKDRVNRVREGLK
jgi:dehydrogenase/reductase SDR family protein 7